MRYIIVGKTPNSSFNKCYQPLPNDYLIGLDEGALTIINSGYQLDAAFGDYDNLDNDEIIKKSTKAFFKYPCDKNETDLELVLMNLTKADECLIYDCLGGRLDHELVNILLLSKYQELNLKLIDEYNYISYYYKKGEYQIKQDDYQYVSIITLNKATISITKGKYLLKHAYITKLDTYTTSNRFMDQEFNFTLEDGDIIVIRSK